jgi:hypothetical protein
MAIPLFLFYLLVSNSISDLIGVDFYVVLAPFPDKGK